MELSGKAVARRALRCLSSEKVTPGATSPSWRSCKLARAGQDQLWAELDDRVWWWLPTHGTSIQQCNQFKRVPKDECLMWVVRTQRRLCRLSLAAACQ